MSRADVVIAESGVGYRQYRIPALALTPAGTCLAVFDARCDLDDLPAPVDLVARRSTDGGRSFGPQTVVRAGTGVIGHGDASLVVDHESGSVFAFHATSAGVGFFESSESIKDDDLGVLHCDVSVSHDDGVTWEHRRLSRDLRVGLNARLPEVGLGGAARVSGLFAASGSGTQIRAGRLHGRLLQGFVALIGTQVYAAVAHSDDHGRTWVMGRPVGPGANENAVVWLGGDRVGLQSRAPGQRLMAWSDDGGDTFGPLEPAGDLLDPGNNGSLVRLDPPGSVSTGDTGDTGDCGDAGDPTGIRLACTHTSDPDLRRNLVVSTSTDDGATFTPAVTLTAGAAGYSVAQPLPGGALGVLWEDEGYRRLIFTRLEPGWELPRAAHPAQGPAPALVLDHVAAGHPATTSSPTPAWVAHPPIVASEWGPTIYKIVASRPGGPMLRSRAAYRELLGDPAPGLHVNDILTFSARFPLPQVTDVRLDGVPVSPSHIVPVGSGTVLRGLRRVVRAQDVEAGVALVRVSATDGDRTAVLSARVPVELATASADPANPTRPAATAPAPAPLPVPLRST